nr:hypothetical protein [Kofleriaceae bacterium]
MNNVVGPWAIVLAQITEWEHAAAVVALFEHRDDDLYADDDPIHVLCLAAHGFLLPTERGVASVLADHLNGVPGHGGWDYIALYSPTRGRDATSDDVASLVERCRMAGVALHHRPSRLADDAGLAALRPPEPPWSLVFAEVRELCDAAALVETCPWWTSTANDTPMSAVDLGGWPSNASVAAYLAAVHNRAAGAREWTADQILAHQATPVEVAAFVARCAAAGVRVGDPA